jgi:hypothetical protein
MEHLRIAPYEEGEDISFLEGFECIIGLQEVPARDLVLQLTKGEGQSCVYQSRDESCGCDDSYFKRV